MKIIYIFITIMFILCTNTIYYSGTFFYIENDLLKLSNNLYNETKNKCSKYIDSYNVTYKKLVKNIYHSKYYILKKKTLYQPIHISHYCFPNRTCKDIKIEIVTSITPVIVLTHFLFTTKSNVIYDCKNAVLFGQCKEKGYYRKNLPSLFVNSVKVVDIAIFMGGWHTSSVYHGVIDITRIISVYHFLLKHKEIYIQISSPRYSQDEVRYLLNLIGFSNSRIINDNLIFVKHLYIPFPFYCGLPATFLVRNFNKLLRINIKNKYNLIKSNTKNIVLIQRLKSRTLNNLKVIKKLLESFYPDHVISIYYDSNINLTNIIKLFYYADVVIGAHGAGLSNIIACKEGTYVFEIGISYFIDLFAKMSSALKLKYYQYYSESKTIKQRYFHINESDFIYFVKAVYKH